MSVLAGVIRRQLEELPSCATHQPADYPISLIAGGKRTSVSKASARPYAK
jgi:hypothetical protein